MTTTLRSPSRPFLAGLLALELAAGLAACSGSPGAATGGADAASSPSAQWGAHAVHRVLRRGPERRRGHPRVVVTPPGVDQGRPQVAAVTCGRELGVQPPDAAEKAKTARQYDQVSSCTRDAFPDFPEQEPGSIAWDAETYPTSEEPAFKQRNAECMQEYAPDTTTQHVG